MTPVADVLSSGALGDPGAELLACHLEGDPLAFQKMDRMFRPRLEVFIDRMIRDTPRAEELVQETMLRVHRHASRFDPARRFSTWIFTIAGNLARDEIRRQSRARTMSVESLTLAARERALQVDGRRDRPDEVLEDREILSLLVRSAGRLSDPYREVFRLREVEGLTYEEIAEHLRLDLGTVKSRLSRARRRVARMLEPTFGKARLAPARRAA